MRWVSMTLIAVGVILIAGALASPLRRAQWLYLGLGALVLGAITTSIRLLATRAPYKGRSGAVVTVEAKPIAWLLGYVLLIAMLIFIAWFLLRAYGTA